MPEFFPFPIKLSCYSVGASPENRFKYTSSIVMPHQKTNKITGSSFRVMNKTDNFTGFPLGIISLPNGSEKSQGKQSCAIPVNSPCAFLLTGPGKKKAPKPPELFYNKIGIYFFLFSICFPYRFINLSTRPAVSTSFTFPV